VLIALTDLRKGDQISFDSQTYTLESDVPAKHKFAAEDLAMGATVRMYGVTEERQSRQSAAARCLRRGISIIRLRNFSKRPKNSAGPRRTFHDGSSASFLDTAGLTDR